MATCIHPKALHRLTILGPLASRDQLAPGELKVYLDELAKGVYRTPDGKSVRYSAKTIERWYYLWRRHGVTGLEPKPRDDQGRTSIDTEVVDYLLQAKRDLPSRSITTLIQLAEQQGKVSRGQLSRSSVHRVLVHHRISKRTRADSQQIERRSFEAQHIGDIWQGDVMHGPKIDTEKGRKKTYLATWMDDASRLICHSAFYLSETAMAVEHALKEALLKRGLPKKILIDNGPAYRAESLQSICARLDIRLVHSRPYEPQSKGKLERWHKTVRDVFLSELSMTKVRGLDELNAKLWIWLEHYYHQRPHQGLANHLTPLQRWQQELTIIRPLGPLAQQLDEYFYHRIKRGIRKDGTLSYQGRRYEVPHACSQDAVYLIIDAHQEKALWVESLAGKKLGDVYPLDKQANLHRARQRPSSEHPSDSPNPTRTNLIDVLSEKVHDALDITSYTFNEEE